MPCKRMESTVLWSSLFIICSRMPSITHLFYLDFFWSFILVGLGLNVFRGLVPFTFSVRYVLFTFVASWRSSWLGTDFWVRSPTSTPAHALALSSQHRYLKGVWHEIFNLKFFFHESVSPGIPEYRISLGRLRNFSVINIPSRISPRIFGKILSGKSRVRRTNLHK